MSAVLDMFGDQRDDRVRVIVGKDDGYAVITTMRGFGNTWWAIVEEWDGEWHKGTQRRNITIPAHDQEHAATIAAGEVLAHLNDAA